MIQQKWFDIHSRNKMKQLNRRLSSKVFQPKTSEEMDQKTREFGALWARPQSSPWQTKWRSTTVVRWQASTSLDFFFVTGNMNDFKKKKRMVIFKNQHVEEHQRFATLTSWAHLGTTFPYFPNFFRLGSLMIHVGFLLALANAAVVKDGLSSALVNQWSQHWVTGFSNEQSQVLGCSDLFGLCLMTIFQQT